MRHLASRLAVALLTFTIGVTAASVWLLRRAGTPYKEQISGASFQGAELAHEADSLRSVFKDFTFVESGAYIPAHGREPKPVPTRFDVGWQYIFHHREANEANNDTLFDELQHRIRSEDFDILVADRIGHRYVGGLLFRIIFRNARHKFTLFNTPDREILNRVGLHKSWLGDDYVLIIEEGAD